MRDIRDLRDLYKNAGDKTGITLKTSRSGIPCLKKKQMFAWLEFGIWNCQ